MRKLLFVIMMLVVAGTAGGGYYWWTVARFIESTDDAYVYSDTSLVSPKVEGYVSEVRAVDNGLVKAGDVLVVIDAEDYAARAQEAEASWNAQRATLATYDSRLKWQRSMIDQAKAQIQSAEADLKRSQLDFDRYNILLRDKAESRQHYETAEADLHKAEAGLAKARAQLAAETEQYSVFSAQREQEEARMHQTEAALTLARNNLSNTVIRAPIDGVIGNKAVQVGQYVRAESQLLSVVPLPNVYIVANFKETQFANIRREQPVTIRLDALPDQRVQGYVESFSPATGAQFSLLPPENATGNFTKVVQRVPVRIAVRSDSRVSGLLRPGLSVVVSIDTREGGQQMTLSDGVFGAVPRVLRIGAK
jgi:membrane fusion protein (multidrug efflux system)